MTLSVGPLLFGFLTVEYLYRRGRWQPESDFAHTLLQWMALLTFSSIAFAAVAFIKDKKTWPKFIALILSVLAMFIVCLQD